MAGVTNLTIEKGADFNITVTLTDGSGNPIDLTSYTVTGYMRQSFYNTENVFSIVCSVLSPSSAGNINLYQAASYTATIPSGRYYYTIQIQSLGGAIQRVLEGTATVTPSAGIFEGSTGVYVGSTGVYTGTAIWTVAGATGFLVLH